jgi:hypothetical protein
MKEQRHLLFVRILVEVIDAVRIERAGPADQAVHFVAFIQQELRQIGAVLAGDAGDQRAAAGDGFSLAIQHSLAPSCEGASRSL